MPTFFENATLVLPEANKHCDLERIPGETVDELIGFLQNTELNNTFKLFDRVHLFT